MFPLAQKLYQINTSKVVTIPGLNCMSLEVKYGTNALLEIPQ